jgi:hypothetical protein
VVSNDADTTALLKSNILRATFVLMIAAVPAHGGAQTQGRGRAMSDGTAGTADGFDTARLDRSDTVASELWDCSRSEQPTPARSND